MISRLMIAATLATASVTIVLWPATAYASESESGIDLELGTAQPVYGQGEPVRLTLAVTNDSGTDCGLTDIPVGTVQVVSVGRDGVELVPTLGRSFYPDGIGAPIAAGLAPVPPGSTVDVTLTSLRVAATGRFSIVVDPGGSTTGSVRLSLTTAT